MSEGLDFADGNARAVLVVGIPYPHIKDRKARRPSACVRVLSLAHASLSQKPVLYQNSDMSQVTGQPRPAHIWLCRQVALKMAYNDAGQARGLLSGRLWYNQQAFR